MAGGFFYQTPCPLNCKGQEGSHALGLGVSMPGNHLLCGATVATSVFLFPGDQRPGPSTRRKRLIDTGVRQRGWRDRRAINDLESWAP